MREIATVQLRQEKETKNCWRFEADDPEGALRYAYIRKSAFVDGVPALITLTIAAVDEDGTR